MQSPESRVEAVGPEPTKCGLQAEQLSEDSPVVGHAEQLLGSGMVD